MPRKPKIAKPKVFISYSWDSELHKTWVQVLASRLVAKGVQVVLDQWQLYPGDSLTRFMESGIAQAEYILVICTPNYARRSNRRKGGVGYEQQIISARMLAGLRRKKVIPITRAGNLQAGRSCAIPTHLAGLYSLDMRNEKNFEQELELLLDVLFGRLKSPLNYGEKHAKSVPSRSARQPRLPDVDLDGWYLQSAAVWAEKYRHVFWFDDHLARSSLSVGDYVKLLFRFAVDLGPRMAGFSGERMWVKVVGSASPYLVGELVSSPLSSDDEGWPLQWGDRFYFLPEHVIDIDRPSL